MTKYTVAILLFDDVEELDAVGPYQVFGTANKFDPALIQPMFVSQSTNAVTCVNGMRILPNYALESSPPFNVLVIPGGVGTRKVATNAHVLDWIRRSAPACEWIASVCSGARVTLASGLATGKKITTHWGVVQELRDRNEAEVLDDVRFVRDGNIIHSAGISAGMDMSLWLVGQLAGSAKFARDVQREMEYYPAPPYTHEV